MSNVVYLKSIVYFYDEYKCFDESNLSMIRIHKNECEAVAFDTYNDFDFAFKTSVDMCKEIDKSEFDEALNKYEATLKEIKDALKKQS